MSEGSVTRWVTALKDGDTAAAQPLWERYHRQLVSLARQKLQASRRAADEDDVVQNAFHSFFRGAAQNRFPQLNDRDNLWRLLVVITARKVYDQIVHEHRKKRKDGTLSDKRRMSRGRIDADIEQIVGDEPTPAFAAQVAEEYQRLLARLNDESLQRVAVLRMENFTNEEIAEQMKCSLRTIARKLESIRMIWTNEASP